MLRNISRIRVASYLLLISYIVIGLVLVSWVPASVFAAIGLFVLVGTFGLLIMRLRCPNCGKPTHYNTVRLFGHRMDAWTPWMPKTCQRCGDPL